VAKFLSEVGPLSVWDLGANTALFSRIAAEQGVPTASFEVDPVGVEENYRTVVRKREANASGERFTIARSAAIRDSQRVLYLMERPES
jgi:hypothetical protein